MTKLCPSSQQLFLPAEDYYYKENSLSDKGTSYSLNTTTNSTNINNNNKNVLFKKISPRRRFDTFGLDKTDYKAFALSTTVYPTAVKATLLGELQESNPHAHKCGFDVIERPKEDVSISLASKASSIINAPPPTAEQSHRGPGSTHSTPLVAFVEIPSGDMPGTRRTSVNSKSNATSLVSGDVTTRHHEEPSLAAGSDKAPQYDAQVTKSLHVSAMAAAKLALDEIQERDLGLMEGGSDGEGDEDNDDADEDQRIKAARRGNFKFMQRRLLHERQNKSGKAKENKKEEPRVVSYSRLDGMRLIRYQWQTRDSKTAEDRKDGGDIRDPLYLNTFCADERPVRFNKHSLPSLSRSSRPRPWTVAESDVSNRKAQLAANRRSFPVPSSSVPFKTHPTTTRSNNFLQRGNSRTVSSGFPNLRTSSSFNNNEPKGTVFVSVNASRTGGAHHSREDVEVDSGEDHGTPLLEIRSCLADKNAITDQRDKLKGKDGCLNSRVKQCVRFVRYRERLDKQEDYNRPMKSEAGRYRPFSKTDVRNHYITNPPPTPELKLQQSVETYQKYMDNIARQTNLSSPRPFTFRGHSTGSSSRPPYPPAIDSDSMIVQSVVDSNRPDVNTAATNSRVSLAETPRPQNSAIYTKDVSAVGHVLDIKRLSPKISTNRIVPGTRVAYEKQPTPTPPRYPSASTDEGVDMAADNGSPSAQVNSRGDAIVVPMGAKSECPSEYSVAKDE